MNVNPTRMELSTLKKRLVTATKGHKLLKDKRDELMRRFLQTVRENKDLRIEVEAELKNANRHFSVARSVMEPSELAVALMAPKQEINLDITTKNVMSVNIPVYEVKAKTGRSEDIYSYGYAFTSAELDTAVSSLSAVMPKLLRLAETEKSAQLLSAEIEKTRRRVNALEHVMIPDLKDTIKYITMKLDENERSSTARLMKVKDMMLEKAHHWNGK